VVSLILIALQSSLEVTASGDDFGTANKCKLEVGKRVLFKKRAWSDLLYTSQRRPAPDLLDELVEVKGDWGLHLPAIGTIALRMLALLQAHQTWPYVKANDTCTRQSLMHLAVPRGLFWG
jgi:hypothetical protein